MGFNKNNQIYLIIAQQMWKKLLSHIHNPLGIIHLESRFEHFEDDIKFDNIDIDKLPVVDVEYYFINLRGKSVGEVVESRYRCNNEVDGKTCNNIMEQEINLLDIKVEQSDVPSEIQITDIIVNLGTEYSNQNSVSVTINYKLKISQNADQVTVQFN